MALLKQKQIDGLISDLGSKLNLSGGTMTGDLVLNGDPDSDLKAATKQYVDSKVASSVNYRGGYDASTNTPNLDNSPSGVSIGDMYTVTVAGTFFTIGVEVGDVLIAEKDDPTLESDWTIVNKNLDASSIKIAYESNANTNAFTDADESKLDGIEALADVTDTANVTSAGALMDTEVDQNIKTLSLPANTTISSFARTLLDDTTQGAAQTTLGVDPAGTDNSVNVTLAGQDFLSISGQQITANPINIDNLSATGTANATTFLRGDNTWAVPADLTAITEEDVICPVASANTNFNFSLTEAPSGGIAGIVSIHINGHSLSAAELISVVGTTITLNVSYAVNATDVVTVRHF